MIARDFIKVKNKNINKRNIRKIQIMKEIDSNWYQIVL